MCCFSRPVYAVEGTKIYARAEGPRQLVVYEMRVGAREELAMVLPIPVAEGAGEDAISFVDLSGSPAFFRALEFAFREHEIVPQSRGGEKSARLAVQQVGAFEASFVPSAADFDRLDPRFAIASDVWRGIPSVAGFGFVVFRLRTPPDARGFLARTFGGPRSEATPYHPMAFWFPRRDPTRTFFPTLHIHDGAAHARARFDHWLYTQAAVCPTGWTAGRFGFRDGMMGPGKELVLDGPGQRLRIEGEHANTDTWIAG
jgi:hypothetical protein